MKNDRRTPRRTDIQALRAVAVMAVVLFHLWPNRLTGGYVGVDVFFVISGFLITSHLVRDAEADRFSVTQFWSRRLLRLLPASLVVLATTVVGVWVLAPLQHWEQWFREIAASGLYVQNWVLAGDAVDYLGAENLASPVQHFWSLSAEEQFYLVWPLLIALAVLIGRRRSRTHSPSPASWRPVAAGLLALVVVASLATSVVWTASDQAYAYFITPTRAWEFGAGALLAFLPVAGRSLGPVARGLLVWTGLALIVVSSITFTDATPFPGAWAAIPVLGTALVIWAQATDRFTTRLAGLTPVQFLGDVSYAVYLWHWPLIVLVPYAVGHDLRLLDKLAILTATVLLAWATRRWIEMPVLQYRQGLRPWATFLGTAVASSLVVGTAFVGLDSSGDRVRDELATANEVKGSECFGAHARPPQGEACTNTDLVGVAAPAPAVAAKDTPKPFSGSRNKCSGTARAEAEPTACERGDRGSDVRIALVGDSHAAHYSTAFVEAAKDNGWALDIYVKPGCPFSDVMRVQDEVLTAACIEWVDRTRQALVDGDYDLVVTSQLSGVDWALPADRAAVDEQRDAAVEAARDQTRSTTLEGYVEDGLISIWAGLADQGMSVAAINDVPDPDPKVVECLTAPGADPTADCRVPRADATRSFDPQPGAVERLGRPDVTLIDFTDVYCDDRECHPVIGGATVYRDKDHLTDTFAGTLSPYLAEAIAPLLRRAGA
ncbi:acyltransferase family protein [Promicromonospora vindobonensis]|uniref:Acyltransferase family protein n=1 Tax=Promicromonospora vindobonensis TaxID=195748 RepID=A0ABW5VMY2_9MICO